MLDHTGPGRIKPYTPPGTEKYGSGARIWAKVSRRGQSSRCNPRQRRESAAESRQQEFEHRSRKRHETDGLTEDTATQMTSRQGHDDSNDNHYDEDGDSRRMTSRQAHHATGSALQVVQVAWRQASHPDAFRKGPTSWFSYLMS